MTVENAMIEALTIGDVLKIMQICSEFPAEVRDGLIEVVGGCLLQQEDPKKLEKTLNKAVQSVLQRRFYPSLVWDGWRKQPEWKRKAQLAEYRKWLVDYLLSHVQAYPPVGSNELLLYAA